MKAPFLNSILIFSLKKIEIQHLILISKVFF